MINIKREAKNKNIKILKSDATKDSFYDSNRCNHIKLKSISIM